MPKRAVEQEWHGYTTEVLTLLATRHEVRKVTMKVRKAEILNWIEIGINFNRSPDELARFIASELLRRH